MATAPKMKPASAAGKQETPTRAASRPGDNGSSNASILSPFEEGLCAARESLLGAPDDIGDLERETWACECSTREAIREAQPTEKKSAFQSGSDELQKKLCESATKYYNDCFELALSNRTELDARLSIIAAEIGRTKIENPAEFARDFTAGDLATFLGVTAIDGKKKVQEIDSNGRLREFVRYVCGESLNTEQNTVFRLPQWFDHKWNIKASLSKLARRPPGQPPRAPAIDESITLSAEETENFILGMEESLVRKLNASIARAHRIALVKLGKTAIATPRPSETGGIAAQEVWRGTARQLGDEVFEQYRKGKIAAKSERDALNKACLYFVHEDGTPFKAKNIFQSLNNRANYEHKGPSQRSRALSTLVKRFANLTSQ